MMAATRFDMSPFIQREQFAKAANTAEPVEFAGLATLAERSLADSVAKLPAMPCPIPSMMPRWPSVVSDAVWLQESGKAGQAIDAGWSVMELFGWSASSWVSLAIWLKGNRSLLVGQAVRGALCTKWACKRVGNERRWFIRNQSAQGPDDAVLLWDVH